MTARGLADVLHHGDELIEVELDGELLIYSQRLESLTVLDETGTLVWRLLDGTVPLMRVCEELADAYAAPLSAVQADVLRLVSDVPDGVLVVAQPH